VYNRYRFRVVAIDGGEPRRSGSVDVIVTVTDVNDNSPTFSSTSLEAHVREDSRVGTVICRATASDADIGPNAELRYQFTAETRRQYGAMFDIWPDTGAVVVAGALDYETRRDYSLYVTATDRAGTAEDGGGGALTGMISVNVRVEDVNDHAPEIAFHGVRRLASADQQPGVHQRDVVSGQSLPTVTIDGVPRVGSFVAHVTVRDADDGENGRFRCVLLSSSGNRHERKASGNRFTLRQIYDTEYTIVTTAPLDDLTATSDATIMLDVYCADGGRPPLTSEASLVVNVGDPTDIDENTLSDVFQRKVITIAVAEDVPIGTEIYCPRRRGSDKNSVIKSDYRITDVSSSSGSSVLRFLDVDASSGVVRTKLVLDRMRRCLLEADLWNEADGTSRRQSGVRLSVVVVWSSRRRRSYDDDVTVRNTNVDYEFSVAENSPGGTYVGSVSATDLCLPMSNAADDRVVYELVGDHASTLSEVFQVGAGSGRLTTVAPLDRELRRDYTLVVLTRLSTRTGIAYVDAAGCRQPAARRALVVEALARLHVTVTDVNDNPPAFEFPRPGHDVMTVPRTAAKGHVVSRVIARDQDAGHNATVSYRIESNAPWSRAFGIDSKTGITTVSVNLPFIVVFTKNGNDNEN